MNKLEDCVNIELLRVQVAGAVVTHIGCAVVYCHSYSNSQIVKGHAYNTVCNYYPS